MYPGKVSEPEVRDVRIRFTGASAATPTKNLGKDVTISYISTGLYELTWAAGCVPGVFASVGAPAYQATTASQVAGYTAAFGDFDATTRKLRVSVYNSSFALADLTSTQKLAFTVTFKATS